MSDTNALEKVFLAAVGGATLSYEKARDLVDEMVSKGKITVQEGKDLTEDLKQTAKGHKDNKKTESESLDELTAEVIRLKGEVAELSSKLEKLAEDQGEDKQNTEA